MSLSRLEGIRRAERARPSVCSLVRIEAAVEEVADGELKL